MYSRVFLDANVIADMYDHNRPFYAQSKKALLYLSDNDNIMLFTSCDIITTLYYIFSKNDKSKALGAIMQINTLCEVVEFGNEEVTQSCLLMYSNNTYKDLEDTIQYVMAKKVECDLILSNDKGFISEDIEVLTTEEFSKRL
ncbi:MAG: PIN domain-containing protein [Campylobacterales bacterium]|nr:PIN domain-containing protein [Campylobacterales bacterium]